MIDYSVKRGGVSRTLLCAVMHFAIDFICIATMSLLTSVDKVFLFIVAYDILAFVLQQPIGAVLDNDRHDGLHRLGAVAFLVVGIGALCANIALKGEIESDLAFTLKVTCVVCLIVGNALFHSVGACATLDDAGDRTSRIGLFVAPGAIGVCCGMRFFSLLAEGMPIIAVACAIVFLCLFEDRTASLRPHFLDREDLIIVSALCACAFLRSFIGAKLSFAWSKEIWWAGIALVGAVFLGKTLGGFLSDVFSEAYVTVVSLVCAAVAIFFGDAHVAIGFLGTFLFNMTMAPVTMTVVRVVDDRPGEAFGLVSAMLGLGGVFAMAVPSGSFDAYLLPALCIVSCAFAWPAMRRVESR